MKTQTPSRPTRPAAVMLAGVVLLLLAPSSAQANPKIRTSFFKSYPYAVGTQLDDLPSRQGHCGVCHYNFQNGGDPWNPYGQSIRDIGGLNKEPGISNAIWTVRNLDRDGDGYTAQTEITDLGYANTPTFPGLQATNTTITYLTVNIPLSEIQPYLTPTTTSDTTPPSVTVLSPNGGEIFVANQFTNVTWAASDATSDIAAIHIYVSRDDGATFSPVALGLGNSGSYAWVINPTSLMRRRPTSRRTSSPPSSAPTANGSPATIIRRMVCTRRSSPATKRTAWFPSVRIAICPTWRDKAAISPTIRQCRRGPISRCTT